MPRIAPQTPNKLTDPATLALKTKSALDQVRSQNNLGAQLLPAFRGVTRTQTRGLLRGDTLTGIHPRGVQISVAGDKGSLSTVIVPRDSIFYISQQSGSGAPTTDNFPESQNYGWYLDTATSVVYWAINIDGTLYYNTASGGGINFTEISGTITDDQHGVLGRQTGGGSPHHTNATTAQPGFLSTTFFDRLNNATASATASTLCLRDGSGNATFATVTATTGAITTVNTTTVNATTYNGTTLALSGNASGANADFTTAYLLGGATVVNGFDSGWTAMTGSGVKGGISTGATTQQVAEVLKALIDALLANNWISA